MEFGILGPLEVWDQHRRIAVSGAKERLLLAALVVHANQVISADRLMEVLWGAEPPATAGNTLQTYVSHLRRALEPDRLPRAQGGVLRTRGQGYELVVPPESVDAVRFERLAAQGREALPADPAGAAETLRAALGLWRGEVLAEFGVELFAQAEITRLNELRASVLEDRVEADLALGRHATLCCELTRAVAEHPLRERLWSQLIRALYRSGRQVEALEAFAQLRAQLAGMLGIDPSPELVRLHQEVLAQRPDLEWRTVPPQSARPPSDPATAPTADSLLPAARTAFAGHDWERAFDLFSRAEQAASLSAADLDSWAEAACWSGRYRAARAGWQRAHHAYLRAGDHRRAAVVAFLLMLNHQARRQFAMASGWFRRAQRLLQAEPDCAERGYLSWAAMSFALAKDDRAECLAAARSTFELGVRHDVADFQAVGMVFEGAILIRHGQVADGLALHDEGMVMAVSGDLSRLATAQIYCQIIRTCYELGDYRRAHEWTTAIEDRYERTGLSTFLGDCEIHRIAVMISRGAWTLAEQEARRACAAAERSDVAHVGQALVSIGDVRLRVGDLDGADEAFTRAEELLGVSPMPGRARLELQRGHPAEAATLINAALAGDGWDRLARTRLLPDQVTIALAVHDLDTARAATTELAEVAQTYGSKALLAAAERARGELALATHEDCPLVPLRRSVELWQQADAPYDGARTRMLLAAALAEADQPEAARLERTAALACFTRLGARLDAQAAAEPAGTG